MEAMVHKSWGTGGGERKWDWIQKGTNRQQSEKCKPGVLTGARVELKSSGMWIRRLTPGWDRNSRTWDTNTFMSLHFCSR